MLSTPPAMHTSASPQVMACAAPTSALRPEPHSRLCTAPGVSTGRPASSSAWRATLRLSSPAWLAQPTDTSSMVSGAKPERATTSLTTPASRSSGRTRDSAPAWRPNGVRSPS